MDWAAGHLTIIVGTGSGAFANKSCSQGWAFDNFFQVPGEWGWGMLAAGIDSHIIVLPQLFPPICKTRMQLGPGII